MLFRLKRIPLLEAATLSTVKNLVHIQSNWAISDSAKLDKSYLSKSWIFDKNTNSIIPLESSTNSTPLSVLKKSSTTAGGQFAQIVQIEVDKNKEYFVELWNQD